MRLSKALAAGIAAASVASAFAVSASAYNGYIGFQTTVYSFRNNWDESNYGQASGYFDNFIVWGNNDPETFPDYEDNFDYDLGGYLLDATYEDVTIDHDGTYTVTAKDIDWALDGSSDFNLIFVSTDIPNDGTVTCTNAKVIIDGNVVKSYDELVVDDSAAYFGVYLVNIWNPDIGSWGEGFPTKSLSVEFTLEGLDAPAEAAPEAPAEEAPAEAPAEQAPAAGDVAASTDSSKGSPDTGIEDVAVIGGLAILAGAAIAFTRKRK